MYSEKTYKNYIFWVQVKRLVVIVILSCIGAGLGILIGKILESTIKLTSFHNAIIIGSTVVFFLLSLLLTSGIGKEVQDGYWRIAVLRKLTVIQKNLELNNELLKNNNYSNSKLSPISSKMDGNEEFNDSELEENSTSLVPKESSNKVKFSKKFKKSKKVS